MTKPWLKFALTTVLVVGEAGCAAREKSAVSDLETAQAPQSTIEAPVLNNGHEKLLRESGELYNKWNFVVLKRND